MKHNYLFLIGAAKSATTSVAAMLSTHPDVAVAASKEPCFFTDFAARDWSGPSGDAFSARLVRSLGDYDSEFAANPDASWRVDASTDYLSCPVSPQRIAEFAASERVGRVIVMAILRDPLQRALSEYQHTLRDGHETLSLRESLDLEATRREDGFQPLFWHVERSSYATHIARWRSTGLDLNLFGYEAVSTPDTFIRDVFKLMDLAPLEAMPKAETKNRSYTYKNPIIGQIMRHGAVLRAARGIVPKQFRAGVKDALLRVVGAKYTPGPDEIALLREALQSEIDACVQDPAIPTDGWTLSKA
ncbi:hypothetical protein [Pacificoceanicola onchidii]|uniref:hypothetical protein n=1 Tax=Pacificoceanicola onchidii TaxID=2562685 RepID=UPI0010A6177F|nr:hypothetical protein [Pacificoceanicola onchidii]